MKSRKAPSAGAFGSLSRRPIVACSGRRCRTSVRPPRSAGGKHFSVRTDRRDLGVFERWAVQPESPPGQRRGSQPRRPSHCGAPQHHRWSNKAHQVDRRLDIFTPERPGIGRGDTAASAATPCFALTSAPRQRPYLPTNNRASILTTGIRMRTPERRQGCTVSDDSATTVDHTAVQRTPESRSADRPPATASAPASRAAPTASSTVNPYRPRPAGPRDFAISLGERRQRPPTPPSGDRSPTVPTGVRRDLRRHRRLHHPDHPPDLGGEGHRPHLRHVPAQLPSHRRLGPAVRSGQDRRRHRAHHQRVPGHPAVRRRGHLGRRRRVAASTPRTAP